MNKDIKNQTSNIIFADKLTSFGFGTNVSRLNFGVETAPNEIKESTTVVMPTHALIEVLEFMLNTIKSDKDLQQALINGCNEQINLIKKQSK